MSVPLRIGLDAREVLGDTTGVGRYLGELIRRWVARPDANARHLLLYVPEPLALQLPPESVTTRVIAGGRGTWWEQTALGSAVRDDRPDVFFAPAYTAPLGIGVPVAVTIHDISFVAHPEWYRAREGVRRRWLTRRAAENASIIFTDSDFSRREIEQHFRVSPSKLKVIPPGVTPRRTPAPAAIREPLVLFVGSLFNRRRLPDLIAAFARVVRDLPGARLAIVGDDRTWPPQDLPAIASAHGIESRVEFRSYVTDDELGRLYGTASVFAFLSEYEGFGLTPLEALAADVPVVVLDTPVAREVYGEAATYVKRDDIHGTADALRRLLASPSAAAAQLAHAPGILGRYSWEAAAARTLEHIERIARP